MGLAAQLLERGAFSNVEWSDALGEALRAAVARGEPDDPQTYYRSALEALQCLLARGGGVSREAMDERTEAWRRAYRNTPHGAPVVLDAADR